MDLYVKLQGLKYNSRKVWGMFIKFPGSNEFMEFTDLFF
jgi:hypothetical protein